MSSGSLISTSKHNQSPKIAFYLLYFFRRGWGRGVNFEKEKDWIIKSFSKVTVTIYELLCSSLPIIINVFNTISGKIIKQAVLSTVMLAKINIFSFDLCFSKICDGLKSVSILSSFYIVSPYFEYFCQKVQLITRPPAFSYGLPCLVWEWNGLRCRGKFGWSLSQFLLAVCTLALSFYQCLPTPYGR